MKRVVRQGLPVGFRHLFSLNEIKVIQEQIGIRFDYISFGHSVNADNYQPEQVIQSSFHPITINGYQKEKDWILRVSQSGFRKELLPIEQEVDTKFEIVQVLSLFLLRVVNSKETDFLRRPQLMVDVSISSNQVTISTRESK